MVKNVLSEPSKDANKRGADLAGEIPQISSAPIVARRQKFQLPRLVSRLGFLAFLLAVVFFASPFIANSPLFANLPGQKEILDFAAAIPLMIVGYAFGILGGITRTASEYGFFFLRKDGVARISSTFVSGVLGMMTYLALDSGFILKLVYPDIIIPPDQDIGFRGVAIAAFLVGFFSGETILVGRTRIQAAIRKETNQDQLEK
jgi:hypothetical protein